MLRMYIESKRSNTDCTYIHFAKSCRRLREEEEEEEADEIPLILRQIWRGSKNFGYALIITCSAGSSLYVQVLLLANLTNPSH